GTSPRGIIKARRHRSPRGPGTASWWIPINHWSARRWGGAGVGCLPLLPIAKRCQSAPVTLGRLAATPPLTRRKILSSCALRPWEFAAEGCKVWPFGRQVLEDWQRLSQPEYTAPHPPATVARDRTALLPTRRPPARSAPIGTVTTPRAG